MWSACTRQSLHASTSACIPTLSRGMRRAALAKLRESDIARPNTPKALPAKNNPKRDPTVYGIPRHLPAVPPTKEEAELDYVDHPLWAFFHNKEAINRPDRSRDNASESLVLLFAEGFFLNRVVTKRSILDCTRTSSQIFR